MEAAPLNRRLGNKLPGSGSEAAGLPHARKLAKQKGCYKSVHRLGIALLPALVLLPGAPSSASLVSRGRRSLQLTPPSARRRRTALPASPREASCLSPGEPQEMSPLPGPHGAGEVSSCCCHARRPPASSACSARLRLHQLLLVRVVTAAPGRGEGMGTSLVPGRHCPSI